MRLEVPQGSQEWIELRSSKITATDSSVIMEVSPWKTPYQLWMIKKGFLEDSPQTEAMKRGLSLEPEARSKFEESFGERFSPTVIVSDEITWMMASLDGISESGKEIVEIKCPLNRDDQRMASEGLIPSKYYPQLQHQIAVCGVEKAHYYSYDGHEGAHVIVKRDEPYIKKMMELEKEFYESLDNFVVPKMKEKDFIYRQDDDWEECVSLWRECSRLRKKYEDQENFFKSRLLEMCSGKNTKGCGISVSKHMRKGAIVYKNVPGIELLDVEKGRGDPIEVWRITE